MPTPTEYTYITLRERPKTNITPQTFQIQTGSFQSLESKISPSSDEVLVQTNYISLDPAMRGWLNDTRSYVPPVKVGETMRAGGIGTVIRAGGGSSGDLKVGDLVYGTVGELYSPSFRNFFVKINELSRRMG
jgi:NADPH-dependent curcumin reductase CurA